MPFVSVPVFHSEVLGRPTPEKGLLDDTAFNRSMLQLQEEIDEFEDAHDTKDFIGCVDANIDIIYFAVGNLHQMGLSSDEMTACFKAVHEANMTKKAGMKVRGGVECEGDAVKPEGWVSPEERIAAILGGCANEM